ncbi:MAG: glycosyltransferase [Candidatus Methanomethylicaceae archaeon]
MRIVVVGGMPPNPEGEAHYAGRVYRALAEQMKNVIIVALAHIQPNIPTSESPMPNYTIYRVTYGYHRLKRHLAPLYIWHALQSFRPEIVHFQAPHKNLYGGIMGEPLLYLFRWLCRCGIPTIVTVHSLWLSEDFIEMGIEHGLHPCTILALKKLYRYYFKQLLKVSSQINVLVSGDENPVISRFQQEWGLEQFPIYAEAHPCELFNLHASDTVVAKTAIGLDSKRLVFAFGFMRPDKGFHYLMEAIAPLIAYDPDLALVIAGSPGSRLGKLYIEQLKNLYIKLGEPLQIRLEFGYLPDERLHLYLRACDVVVVPYTRAMGASGPMHHALSYGKPVIATAVGQNIGLAKVCHLVPPRDPVALRNALRELLYEPGYWEYYHQQAIQYAANHTWYHLAQRYYQDYERLTQKGKNINESADD